MRVYTVSIREYGDWGEFKHVRIVARTAAQAIDGAQMAARKKWGMRTRPRDVRSVVFDFEIDRVQK